jgi:putative intracellular protease/amidase/YHS domain-containing protein
MTRRTLLTAAAGAAAAHYSLAEQPDAQQNQNLKPLTPPAEGRIPVAFPISEGAVTIDYAGPWEVFQDANRPTGGNAFELYTVAESKDPVVGSGGLKLLPDYTFDNAPAPKIIVIPAQKGNDAMLEWIRKSSKTADVTMSVCTGAFILAKTGLLAGKAATTHHSSYGSFQMQYRDIKVQRGFRFVEAEPNLATAGGLTSGIDLALRVVERYFGRASAEGTAFYMEYQGEGWKDSTGGANQAYAKPNLRANQLACPVCGMVMSAEAPIQSTYKGIVYRFCSDGCKGQFNSSPASFIP